MGDDRAPKRQRLSPARGAAPTVGYLAQYGCLFRGGACVNDVQAVALRLAFALSAQTRVGEGSHPAGLIGDVRGMAGEVVRPSHSSCTMPRLSGRRWPTTG